jgi:two-component system, sensor histidine kinase and response regulator
MKEKKKVFIIDDDIDFLRTMQEVLEDAHYEVEVCDKPTESLSQIKKFQPDCLILDLKMPLFNGNAFLPWIRRQFFNLPIVVCTGLHEYDRRNFLQHDVYHVVEKPFQTADFLDAIAQAIREQALQQSMKSMKFPA